MKKFFPLIFAIGFSLSAIAQQHSIYSQYIFNLYAVNPAYAGERDALSAALSYRAQWVGFEGSPKTQNFSLHSPLPYDNLAVGLSFQNDEIGARNTQNGMLGISYKLKINRDDHLSFALQGGVFNYQYNWEKLNYRQGLDPVRLGADPNKWVPNFDAGIMYISPKAYAGLSVTGLNNAEIIESSGSDARFDGVATFIAGKIFPINRDLSLKPSTIVRKSLEGPFQFDVNMSAFYKNKFWLTATYRYQFGAVVSGHFYITDKFHVGYAYDLPLNNLLAEQSGTHEIFIGYDFPIYNSRKGSPRNF
jgi:type IX secretion system PorP/SprF family membrane protein